MKTIVLHIGYHKTGTSAIQKTLAANARLLEKKGILYPVEDLSSIGISWGSSKHHWLGFLVSSDIEDWPRPQRKQVRKADASHVAAEARKCMERLLEDIRNTKAQHVVISSEFLSRLNPEQIRRLKALFEPLDAKFKVVCYYRNPAKAYLSSMQQRLKAQAHHKAGERISWPVSQLYKNYEAVFGKVVTVRLFDRKHLEQRDVTVDFLKVLELDEEIIGTIDLVSANSSDPAELSAAQDWIRSRAFQDRKEFSGVNRKLNQALREAQKSLELNRQELVPNAAKAVLYANRDELYWLRDALGLAFDEIDYEALEVPPSFDMQQADFEDVLQFDAEKRDLLVAKAIRELCEQAAPEKIKSRPFKERLSLAFDVLFRS